MISEFERRLAEVLGARLPAPFEGRVDLPPVPPADRPFIGVGTRAVRAIEPDLGSRRPERVPGADDPRRVLRLSCDVAIRIHTEGAAARAQQLQALDAVLVAVDAADLRNGTALAGPADPGFLIQLLAVREGALVVPDAAADLRPAELILQADGWFWPVGVAGEAGVAIGEIRIRGVALPLVLSPAPPPLRAGGPAVTLTIGVGAPVGFRIQEPPVAPLPFGALVFSLRGTGGRPGSGRLEEADAAGVLRVALAGNRADISYQPPAAAASDQLLIALDDGAGGPGIEIGRFTLRVREA